MSKVKDPFEKWPVAKGEGEHLRVNKKKSGGWFCMICGAPIEDYEPGHGSGLCEDNPELVAELRKINGW